MTLLAKDANQGLAAARNAGFDHARAPLVMVMDADNMIYPTCLRKLADALNDHSDVDAVYAILEDFGDQRNIRSAVAWDVDRLCRANYIDAQAMLRKSAWQRLGGYRADDDLVYGWEDWDLWLRLAATGGRAMLVSQILGRYRVQRGSMIALTNLATDDAIAAIRQRYPTLPWPSASTRSAWLATSDSPAEYCGHRSRRLHLVDPPYPIALATCDLLAIPTRSSVLRARRATFGSIESSVATMSASARTTAVDA